MRYQLVLQFRAHTAQGFNALIELEDLLIKNLALPFKVDSHDFGADEFNIFVQTDEPKETFEAAEKIIQQHFPQQQLNAAYREVDKEDFVILWPPNLEEFKIA
jgi:hypothetical protein